MTQEREALKRTLIQGAKFAALVAGGFIAFLVTFNVLATLFDSLGMAKGASSGLAMIAIWFMVAGGAALKWKYDKTLAEIRQRDEEIMRGLKG